MAAPDARTDNYSVTEDQLLVGSANGFLNNDSDPDGDPLSIIRIDGLPFSFGTPITLASGAKLTINADGSFQYDQNGSFTHLSAGQTANDIFTYTISDGKLGFDTSSVCMTISGVTQNPIPILPQPLIINGAISDVVEEEQGLLGGNEDTTDSNGLDTDENGPNTVTNVSAGSFVPLITGGIDGTLSFAFAPLGGNPAVQTLSNGPLKSGGKQVYFDTEGPNLIGYYNANGDISDYDSATDTKVFTMTLASTGVYAFTLHVPVDQPIGGEDIIAINLNGRVTVTDSGGPGADTNVPLNASITVIDDTPLIGTPTAALAGELTLDESAVATDTAGGVLPVGVVSVTANFAGNFAAASPSYGADGAGSTSLAFELSSEGLGSGLYALDNTDTTRGAATAVLSNVGPTWHVVAAADFNGDGKSDILWQGDDGTAAMWLMDGTNATFVGAAGPFNPGPTWHIKGTGDFNGDGKSDILWQGDDGTAAMWLMDGPNATFVGAAGPFNPGPGWEIKGTGDFNGDGKSDILWQGDDGTAAMWLMDGPNATFVGAAGPFNPGPSWEIKGTGDFNGDGKSDIIWQGDDGTAAMWLMDGPNATFVGAVGPFNPGPSWAIKGTGDFNGDGKSDIIWQGDNGTAAMWLMDGTNATFVGAVGAFNPGQKIKGTGDFNGDAKADILWQNDSGLPSIWTMVGATDTDGIGQGAEILLYVSADGTTVKGSTAATEAGITPANTYFTITVDNNPASPTFGDVTFTQTHNIWHDDTNDPDDPEALTTAAAGHLTLTQTVTDADGDTDSASINLDAGVFVIQDDGPDAVVIGTPAAIVLDESPVAPGGDGIVSATADFSVNFSAANFGTDGASSARYALVLTGAGVASGLFALDAADTTAGDGDGIGKGASIVLNKVGNDILGQIGGVTYFTISVDGNGVVTFADNTANNLWHSNTGNPDDPQTLTLSDPALLQLTVTDADGDTASAALNLGAGVFTIEDDGPSVGTAGTLAVDEDDLLVPPASFAGNSDVTGAGDDLFDGAPTSVSASLGVVSFGTDGAGGVTAISYTGPALTSGTVPLVYTFNDATDTLTATAGAKPVFTLAVDEVAKTWTFTLLDHLDHPLVSTEDNLVLSFNATVTDGDGDAVVQALSVNVDDDMPQNNAATVNINVDEDELTGLSTGITDGDGTTTVASFTGAQIAGLVASGADGPVRVSLNAAIDNVDTGLFSQNVSILFDVVSPTQVNGVAGARTVFTLVQTAGADTVLGTVDDTFTFTLLDQVDHTPLATGGGDAETIALSLASVFVATDFDGDSVVIDGGATVTIENDVPANNAATVNINVDEDELATALSTGITDGDGTTTVASFTGAQIIGLVASGADEPVTVSLNAAIDNVDTGLDSKGENILFDVVSPTQVNGVAGARVVFTLVQTAGADTVLGTVDDTFTFTLLDQVDHTPLATGGGDAETIALSLASVFVATDFDGDSVVIDAGATVTIENDVPANNAATVNINVDEDELATALSTGITDGDGTTTVASFTGAQIIGLVASGADEPVTVSLNAAIDNVDTGLDSKGENILFDVVSPTQVNGVAGARVVFTLVQTAGADTVLGTVDDTFTFTLLDQVDHTPLATGGGDAETIALSLASVFVATDFDGDSVVIDGGATVTIENDVPANNAATVNINVDEDELATALSTGITDGDGTTTVASFTGAQIIGLVASGADEPVTVSLNAAIDNVDTGLDSKGENILFDVVSPTQVNGVAGARVVFTLVQTAGADTVLGTVDDAFTFTLLDQIDHTPLATGGGDAETIALSLASVFVATDFDGDSVVIDGGATVTIENDVPANNAATVNINVDEDELATALSTGITDGDGTTTVASFTGAQIIGLVASGADEPVTVSLNAAIDNVDTGLDSKGENILFDVVSPTQVNGVAGARVVFTLVQTAGADTVLGTVDDAFTFTLLDQIDHTPLATGGGDAETIALSLASVFVATDFDGDSVVIDAGATVTIENDIPIATIPEYAVLSNGAGSLVVFNLDLDPTTPTLSNNYGADEEGTVRFLASLDGTPSGLTSHGTPIVYDVSPDGHTLTGFAGLTPVFVITLDPASATYSVDMNDVVDSITRVDFNAGAYNFVGGNSEWAEFIPVGETVAAPIDNNSSDLLLTPQLNHQFDSSINTNANEGGVGIGGNVGPVLEGPKETFRIDFVTDLRGNPASTGSGDYDTLSKRDHVFDGHYTTNGASATFTATSGATVNIRAFDDSDADGNVVGPGLNPDTLTGVAISFGNNPPLFIDLTQPFGPSHVIAGHTFTVVFDGDGKGINVGGVFGDSAITTSIAVFTSDGYNALEYTWVSGDPFKIGNFGASIPSTDPVSFDVPIQVVDFDGDTADSSIGLTLAAAGQAIHDYSASLGPVTAVAGSAANPELHIIGSDFNDSLTGNTAANVLSGGKGDDILTGNDGNDTLIGGLGKDAMNGGAGSDHYVFTNLLDSGSSIATADVISGWTSTDVIDLSGIDAISSVDGNQAFEFVAANTPGTVSNSITWTESGGSTNVSLDTNGIAGAEMMVVLTGIGLNLTEANFIL